MFKEVHPIGVAAADMDAALRLPQAQEHLGGAVGARPAAGGGEEGVGISRVFLSLSYYLPHVVALGV